MMALMLSGLLAASPPVHTPTPTLPPTVEVALRSQDTVRTAADWNALTPDIRQHLAAAVRSAALLPSARARALTGLWLVDPQEARTVSLVVAQDARMPWALRMVAIHRLVEDGAAHQWTSDATLLADLGGTTAREAVRAALRRDRVAGCTLWAGHPSVKLSITSHRCGVPR